MVAKPAERAKVLALMQASPLPLSSCLLLGDGSGPDEAAGLRRAVLEAIDAGLGRDRAALQAFVNDSLLGHQRPSCADKHVCSLPPPRHLSASLSDNRFPSP